MQYCFVLPYIVALVAGQEPIGRSVADAVAVEDNRDGSITFRFGISSVEERQTMMSVPQQPATVLQETTIDEGTSARPPSQSSWNAKEVGGGSSPEADYLYELGRSDLNLNIDTAQNSQHLDSLFTGKVMAQFGQMIIT
jgi:hypothetical protein